MKTKFTIAAVAFALCIGGFRQQAAAQWPQATSHEPTATFEFGGLVMDREGLGDSTIVLNDSSTGGRFLTAERATDLGSAAGVQGKVVFPTRRTLQTLELRASYLGWDQDVTLNSGNIDSPFLQQGVLQVADLADISADNPVSPILPVGITADDLSIPVIPLSTGDVSALSLIMPQLPSGLNVDGLVGPALDELYDIGEYTSSYESDYTSIELMSRRNTRPGLTWLLGPRFISVTEESTFTSVGVSPLRIFFPEGSGIDPTANTASTAAVRTSTRNSLIGLQLGLEYNVPVTQNFYFQLNGRGGAFYNGMRVGRDGSPLRQQSAINATDFSGGLSDSDSGEAWLAEVSIRGYVDLIPNRMAAYAGFDALYIDQLALAPAQAVVLDRVENSSQIYAKGLSFGVKMNY